MVFLDGIYPTSSIWLTSIFAIVAFEVVVIGVEFAILQKYWNVITSRKGLFALVVVANIVTFAIGLFIQQAIVNY